MPERLGVLMRRSDAFSWSMERDPVLRTTVVAVAWLDRSPDWDVLVARLDRASRLAPMFRDRLTEPRGRLSRPRWVPDREFDLACHLRRVRAPRPATRQAVLDIARMAAMTSFDQSRALWEFTLVEGVEGRRAALVMKLHHSLTDGIGGVQLMMLMFDVAIGPGPARSAAPDTAVASAAATARATEGDERRDPASVAPARQLDRGHHAAARAGEAGEPAGRARRAAGEVVRGVRGAVPAAASAAVHPWRAVTEATATARSMERTVAPVVQTLSPFMTRRSLGRRLDMIAVQVTDLKRAAASASGTLNDGFLAALMGGFDRYHRRHGTLVDRLRVTLPISIRAPGDPMGGNRITLQRVVLPIGERDPAARVRAAHEVCRAAREERSLPYTDAIAGALNLLPAGALTGIMKHVDFVASDVPGIPFPLSLAGARVTGYYAFGPTVGSSVNATLLSYDETCGVAITADTAAVPDPGTLTQCLVEGFDEVLELGGEHHEVLLPLRGGPFGVSGGPSGSALARTRARPQGRGKARGASRGDRRTTTPRA